MAKHRRRAIDPDDIVPPHLVYDSKTHQWYEPDHPAAPWNSPAALQVRAKAAAAAAAAAAERRCRAVSVPVHSYAGSDSGSGDYCSESDYDVKPVSAQRADQLVVRDSDAHMLAVSADKRQAVWAVRYRRGSQRKWRWAFLGLRFVICSDGDQLIGFSSNCLCPSDTDSHQRAQLDCRDMPDQSNQGCWPAQRMFSCCTQLLAVYDGEAALRQLLKGCIPGDSGSIVKPLYIGGTRYLAVRAGGGFADWGVLDDKMRRCATCPTRHRNCKHVREVLQCTSATA